VYSNSSKVSFISRSLATVFLLQETDRAAVIYTRGCLDAVKEWFKENMIIIGGVAVGLALLQVIYLLEITFLTMSASQWHPIMLKSANGLKHLSHRELLLGTGLTWKMRSERIWKKADACQWLAWISDIHLICILLRGVCDSKECLKFRLAKPND